MEKINEAMSEEINSYYVFSMLWVLILCILLLFVDSSRENESWKPMLDGFAREARLPVTPPSFLCLQEKPVCVSECSHFLRLTFPKLEAVCL